MQIRILYFFYGRTEAVLVHALAKEDRIPKSDLDRAPDRRGRFVVAPGSHRHEEEV